MNLVVIETAEVDRATIDRFRAELDGALARYVAAPVTGPLLVDLRLVSFLDSSGVLALMDAQNAVRPLGGRLEIAADGIVQRILEVMGLWGELGSPTATGVA